MTVNTQIQDSVSWKSQASSPRVQCHYHAAASGSQRVHVLAWSCGITVHCLFGAQNTSDKFRESSPGDPTRTIQLNLGSGKYNRAIRVPWTISVYLREKEERNAPAAKVVTVRNIKSRSSGQYLHRRLKSLIKKDPK